MLSENSVYKQNVSQIFQMVKKKKWDWFEKVIVRFDL